MSNKLELKLLQETTKKFEIKSPEIGVGYAFLISNIRLQIWIILHLMWPFWVSATDSRKAARAPQFISSILELKMYSAGCSPEIMVELVVEKVEILFS